MSELLVTEPGNCRLLLARRYDWPALVEYVCAAAKTERVSILAHCLSSPALMLSLVRGHLNLARVDAIVASQVALHLEADPLGKVKQWTHVAQLLNAVEMVHQQPEDVTHSLIPEVVVGFLKAVAPVVRRIDLLEADDLVHLDRFKVPITFVLGEHNHMFVPSGTERSFDLLCQANGGALYRREVIAGYGHLDCLVGATAAADVFPTFAGALGPSIRAARGSAGAPS